MFSLELTFVLFGCRWTRRSGFSLAWLSLAWLGLTRGVGWCFLSWIDHVDFEESLESWNWGPVWWQRR